MELDEAFGPDTDIDRFFSEVLQALHQSRPGEFEALSDVEVVICVKFDDGRVFTVTADKDRVEVERDEAIDFPIFTVFGRVDHWEQFKTWVLRYAATYEVRKSELSNAFQFTRKFADALERYDVAASISLKDSDSKEMAFEIVLNNYEIDRDFKSFTIALDVGILDDIASGLRTPAEVAKGLKISGDYGIAAELGALVLKFKP